MSRKWGKDTVPERVRLIYQPHPTAARVAQTKLARQKAITENRFLNTGGMVGSMVMGRIRRKGLGLWIGITSEILGARR
jgi:hypothetical protein